MCRPGPFPHPEKRRPHLLEPTTLALAQLNEVRGFFSPRPSDPGRIPQSRVAKAPRSLGKSHGLRQSPAAGNVLRLARRGPRCTPGRIRPGSFREEMGRAPRVPGEWADDTRPSPGAQVLHRKTCWPSGQLPAAEGMRLSSFLWGWERVAYHLYQRYCDIESYFPFSGSGP